MPDLADGESTEVQGSGRKPYVLKNTGGVYSCSCPAWRNQSLGIEQRTCKHLRGLRGDEAEEQRVGNPLPPRKADPKDKPPVLLAHSYDGDDDVTGWWMSEKLDGVRAWWTGSDFVSRGGNHYVAPDWFIELLPTDVKLDGELWIGRGQFQKTVSVVRRFDAGEQWREVRFLIFDAPEIPGPFETRQQIASAAASVAPFADLVEQTRCEGGDHLMRELARVEELGGEGLMLRQPESAYASGRSTTLLKVKTFHDAEAKVTGHSPGAGRHKGRLGALEVIALDGTPFAVGTGFKDAERDDPPPVGSIITYRYQELTDGGVPRFPVFVRVRTDFDWPDPPAADEWRRFELVDERSQKFWEIRTVTAQGGKAENEVRYGKIGTDGRTTYKPFDDPEKAAAAAEKQMAAKRRKGYKEC